MRYLYIITNNINKKSYIGQTKNFKARIRQHINGKKCLISRAINKYGKNNFTFKILAIVEDHIIDETEIKAIKSYNTMTPNGYNVETGGNACKKLNEETKLKLSQLAKGRPSKNKGKRLNLSEEQRQQMRDRNTGKKATDETKKKISYTLKERYAKMTREERQILFNKGKRNNSLKKIVDMCTGIEENNYSIKRRRTKLRNNSSGYIGVSLKKGTTKYASYITYNKKIIHLGYYTTATEAAKAYDAKAKELFGEFANLNFKE